MPGRKEHTMNREAQILAALPHATQDEAVRLVAELDSLRASASRRVAEDRSIDLTDSAVAVHHLPSQRLGHTGQSDWLARAATSHEAKAVHDAAKAEATRWFRSVHANVLADHDEFTTQALGAASLICGQYGEQTNLAHQAFVAQVEHLAGHKITTDASWSSKPCQSCGAVNTLHANRCQACGSVLPVANWGETDSDFAARVNASRRTAVVDNSNMLTYIMDFEQGELDDEDTIALFQHLVDTGLAWSLQGTYGRTAQSLIEAGLVSVGSRKQAADGDTAFCRLCGAQLQQMDYAWYAVKGTRQRDVGRHYCVAAHKSLPGEFGPDGTLSPGTPGGGGGQYDAPAGTIFDAGGNAIVIASLRRRASARQVDGVWVAEVEPGVWGSAASEEGPFTASPVADAASSPEAAAQAYLYYHPTASLRRRADQGFGPDDDHQSGFAESEVPWVEVTDNLDTIDFGWTHDGDPEGADEEADDGEIGPFDASRRTAGYPKGRQPGQEWSQTCEVCGVTETGTDYYNGWPSQDAFHAHLFCGMAPNADYEQNLAIDRYSSRRTAGWSCSRAAGEVMDRWTRLCREQTGSQNTYEASTGATLFFEVSRTEHADGSITGTVYDMDGSRKGSFRIDGDGTVAKYPSGWPFLKTTARRTAASTREEAERAMNKAKERAKAESEGRDYEDGVSTREEADQAMDRARRDADGRFASSRRTADQGFGPDDDHQSGYAETDTEQVGVMDDEALETIDEGWTQAEGSSRHASKAYDEGYEDGLVGDGIQYNPFPFMDPRADEWIRGYRDAQSLAPGQPADRTARRRTAILDKKRESDDPDFRWSGKCERCNATVECYRWDNDVECRKCGAQYNAFGQRLRDNWRNNPSNYDDDIGDMEGYEIAQLRRDMEAERWGSRKVADAPFSGDPDGFRPPDAPDMIQPGTEPDDTAMFEPEEIEGDWDEDGPLTEITSMWGGR